MNWLSHIMISAVAGSMFASMFPLAGHLTGQEAEEPIQIVDRNGRLIETITEELPKTQDRQGVNITVDDGKIVIVDQDGTRREIDVSGAQSIIVNKSVQSIIKDGQEEKQTTGKAIIVGPDGQRQVIELGDSDGILNFGRPGGGLLELVPWIHDGDQGKLPGSFFFSPSAFGKFMIGVRCIPVDDALRAHVDLPAGGGLVVADQPDEDTPAGQASIMRHDILLAADGVPLVSVEDLSGVVQTAGKEERNIDLKLVRRGSEMRVNVQPAKRQHQTGRLKAALGLDGADFRFEQVGPGLLVEDDDAKPFDMLQHFQVMEEKMKSHLEDIRRMQEELRRKFQDIQDQEP